VRPWFGAWGQEVTAEIGTNLGMKRPVGVLVNRVHKRGPADRARLRVGDVILSVNGHEVNEPEALKFRIATLPVGGAADITVWRKGRERTLTVKLVEPPEDPPREITELSGPQPLAGATVANMSPALAAEVGLDDFEPGVIVVRIRRGSTANRLGFRPGDRILGVNDKEIETVRRLKKSLAKRTSRWRIVIERDGKKHNLVFN